MATAKITITDAPHGGVTMTVEATPPIPCHSDGTPDVEHLTDAQATAVSAAMHLAEKFGTVDWRVLILGDAT